MDVLIERACGLDVHKKSVTACIMTPEGKEIKTFRSHTVFLLDLIDWIKHHRCTHVAMESTGKRKSSKTRKGNKYLRSALIEVAHSVSRSDNYLGTARSDR